MPAQINFHVTEVLQVKVLKRELGREFRTEALALRGQGQDLLSQHHRQTAEPFTKTKEEART